MRKKLLPLLFAAFFFIYGGLSSVSAMDLVPKIDNFIFLVDSSGSMGWEYKDSGKTKIVLAKEILSQLNRHIPELGYISSLNTLAPLKTYAEPAVYNTMSYGQAIDTIPTDILTWGFMGNPTPLGESITAMSSTIECTPDSKALILISDGGNNQGTDPVQAARALYEKHHPNLCIHVISLAETAKNQKLLDEIASLNACSESTTFEELQNQDNRAAFVQEVFYDIAADSDQDGVSDIKDQCPGTPLGVAVDAKGCPFDSDGDGVFDYMDECPDTPAGVQVDYVGCPLDTDGDGVPDYLDACPETPADFAVDAQGCPLPITIDLELEFDLNKADIKQKYHHRLEEVAMFLIHHPGVTAVVEGHTDSQGAASYNQKLSKERAQSVVTYLNEKFGVDPSIIQALGYGEERPIATNDTADGRQKNRRVVVVITGAYQTR
jgi:OOP family OmpA-OmpF porin